MVSTQIDATKFALMERKDIEGYANQLSMNQTDSVCLEAVSLSLHRNRLHII
jgi:hypothetical protein